MSLARGITRAAGTWWNAARHGGARLTKRSPDLEGGTMPDLSSPRLVKVPSTAPPYDCQVHGARCPAGADVVPAVPVLPVAPISPAAAAAVSPAAAVSQRSARPAAAAVSQRSARPRQLALVIVEVLAGVRPDRQLVPLATDRVRARVGKPGPAAGRGPAAQDLAHRDVATRRPGRGDDRRGELRCALARPGHALRARGRATRGAGLARPARALALHRAGGGLTLADGLSGSFSRFDLGRFV